MARLRRIGPDGRAGDGAWEIGGGLLLGRSADCDVVLADDQVSRHHARVVPDGLDHVVEDLGSANGVFVGDERVTRSVIRTGQPFRIGGAWLVLEDDDTAPRGGPSTGERPAGRPRLTCALAGCAALLALLVLVGVGALLVWTGRKGERAPAPLPTPEAAATAAPSAMSVPPSEADVLRFTIRVASNPVLAGCASMPSAWLPPLVAVPVAARVRPDGGFAFARDWRDETGAHHVEGTGTWKDDTLSVDGRWTTRRGSGASEQTDSGTFAATGRRLLGAWFGDRIEGEFESRVGSGGPACRERLANGLSRIDALQW